MDRELMARLVEAALTYALEINSLEAAASIEWCSDCKVFHCAITFRDGSQTVVDLHIREGVTDKEVLDSIPGAVMTCVDALRVLHGPPRALKAGTLH